MWIMYVQLRWYGGEWLGVLDKAGYLVPEFVPVKHQPHQKTRGMSCGERQPHSCPEASRRQQ